MALIKLITKDGLLFDLNTSESPRKTSKGEYYEICPICSHTRQSQHQNEKKLGLNDTTDRNGNPMTVWRCNHCGESGMVYNEKYIQRQTIKPIIFADKLNSLGDDMFTWFENERKISKQTLIDLNTGMLKKKILIKWRKLTKHSHTIDGNYELGKAKNGFPELFFCL
jgi:hypothetical protein